MIEFKKFALTIAFVGCFFIFKGNSQNGANVDVEEIYNDWVLSKSESWDGFLVYRTNFSAKGAEYRNYHTLKLSEASNVFLLAYVNIRPARRCGNDRTRYLPEYWKKGIWELSNKGQDVLVNLKYFRAGKGEKYRPMSSNTYLIVALDEHQMVLQEVSNDYLN